MASNGELGDNFTNMNQTVFQFWTKAEHDARVNNYPTDNLNHVIEGAQITTTADDFDSYIATNWTPTDISSTLGVTTSFGSGITGWTYTQVRGEDGYPDYNNRNGYEYARVYAGTGTFACTISKSKLPRGIYKIELGGFSRHSTETTDVRLAEGEYTGITSAFLKANDEQVIFTSWYDTNKNAEAAGFTDVVYSGQSLNEQSKYVNEGCAENVVWIYLDGQTDLTLNVTIPWHRTQSYTVFNNLRVTQYSENVTINEADEQQATAKENVNATLVRTLQPGILNTFCVPFNLTAEQIAASPLKDTEIYQFGRSSDVMIIYDPATAIEAGKPYIVKLADDATESIVNPVFANVNIVETEGVTVGDDDTKVKFVGQPYFNKSINQQYPYVHYITTSGTSKRLSATGNIKGLRAYYLVPESSNGEVKAYFNDIASSIDEIATETINGNEAVFDLSGRRIDKSTTLMPGIYIINGKKVMVK